MTPSLHILPSTSLDLRSCKSAELELTGQLWTLVNRDSRARPSWELRLGTPVLLGLLEKLAEGEAVAQVGGVQLTVYPDPDLEEAIAFWAGQQLDRYASKLARPLALRAARNRPQGQGLRAL